MGIKVGDIVKLKDESFKTLGDEFMGGKEKRFEVTKLYTNQISSRKFADMAMLKYIDSKESFPMPTEHIEKVASGGGKRKKKYSKKKKKSKKKKGKSKRKRSKTRRR